MFLLSGENNNYRQIGSVHFQYDVTVRKVGITPVHVGGPPNPADHDFDEDKIRILNNSFARTFKEATLATTSGNYFEFNNFSGQVSKIMGVLTSKTGEFLSYFDQIKGIEINKTSLRHSLISNHTVAANKGKITSQIPLELIFEVCKTLKKIT